MTNINDILTLDLQEDIKNVIDLEDQSEVEIQQEIESYIVTEGIGRHLDYFVNQFTSNIKETGVWLSGFYGSGKSYFGKMLGYIIDNPLINGTHARERFIPRLKGVTNENLIENSIRKLDGIHSRVIFLDIAKQNTDKGLAFTLFSNFLRNLGLRGDTFGYMEFDLMIDGKFDGFKQTVQTAENQPWDELKKSHRKVARVLRKAFHAMGYSEADYTDTKKIYSDAIADFSAHQFKLELEKYLNHCPEETLVFIFDEASEAISQKKFTLLDLEGISEALSSISSHVWTIAIAQEKLDDVINNANVNRSQLTKVTDRFKTKLHLESTEVDVIIRSRLLQKTASGHDNLLKYHGKNEGLISDITNLKSSFPTKTADADTFSTYYPFHKYQFDILQKFLFSSNALVATQIAARGMIITTFDVLRKRMQGQTLYNFTPGHAICTEAQIAPPSDLVSKYDTAKKILKGQSNPIDGEELLKTIHILGDSNVVAPTVENITKSHISDISTYYSVKPLMEEALGILLEAKVLLRTNNNYKITSDLEGKLLEEMNGFDVELFQKKRFLIKHIKDNKLFTPVATLSDGPDSFKFSILSDQDDELTAPGSKQLTLKVYSLFKISEDRQDFIENIKMETQYQKELITLVPDNKGFSGINKLIGEISRYTFMEDKYANESDQLKRQIVRDFSIIREEKEKHLRMEIEKAYHNAALIYMFDEDLLNPDTFKGTIQTAQRKVIKNLYTKRLTSSLSDALVPKIFTSRKENLSRLFSGNDFNFFDKHGNFIGDHLKVVEEINAKIGSRSVDGRTLESDLSGPPWGYPFGTVAATLATLFRAGRLSVKFNSTSYFSHEQTESRNAFTNTTKFKSASFKSITRALSATQKNNAVQLLMDLDIEEHTGRKMDWTINDFDLADSIRQMADAFIKAINGMEKTVDGFTSTFSTVADKKEVLLGFTGKVTEQNYIEKVENLLTNSDAFEKAVKTVLKTQKFIKKNLAKVNGFKSFMDEVAAEIKKAGQTDSTIDDAREEFNRLYTKDMVKNFRALQEQMQLVKDRYFQLIKTAAAGMSHEYQRLSGKIDKAMKDLKGFPAALNMENKKKLQGLKQYCTDRIIKEPVLKTSVVCDLCGFSLTDILNYTELAPTKTNDLTMIEAGFVIAPPIPPKPDPDPDPDDGVSGGPGKNDPAGVGENENRPTTFPQKPRKMTLRFGSRTMTTGEYKAILMRQLQSLNGYNDNEEIELNIEGLDIGNE